MMRFWTNFAKNGEPGKSSNGVVQIILNNINLTHHIVLDNKEN